METCNRLPPVVCFQYSIGDASAAAACAEGSRGAFNTPLEMLDILADVGLRAAKDFQYSIGDAHEYAPTDRVVVIVCNIFQYSIGDAWVGRGGP